MCLGPEVLGTLQAVGAGVSAITGLKSLFGGSQQMPAVQQSSPVADDAAAKAKAEAAGIEDRNARMKLARSASLLSGGASGDLSTANVAQAGAKSTLGA